MAGSDCDWWLCDEARKRVLLIAASILAARKLSQYDAGTRVPATISAISNAIHWAEQIMAEIGQEAHLVRQHFLCNHHPMERDRYLGLACEIEIGFLLDTVAAAYLAPCEEHSWYKEKTNLIAESRQVKVFAADTPTGTFNR